MKSIFNRVSKLEQRRPPAQRPCPECGTNTTGKLGPGDLRVTIDDGTPAKEHCETCGRKIGFIVRFDRLG